MSARKPFCRSRLDCGGHFAGVAVACCRARNAGSTGSAWRLRDPELSGSGVAVGVGSASEPACVFERAEGAVDLAAFLVAAEQVAGLGAADPVVAVSCERPDVLSGWVAEHPGAAWLGPKPVSTGNGPSAQLPLKVPPKQPQPSTRPRACWVGSQPAPADAPTTAAPPEEASAWRSSRFSPQRPPAVRLGRSNGSPAASRLEWRLTLSVGFRRLVVGTPVRQITSHLSHCRPKGRQAEGGAIHKI